jgi:DNA-binding response OmpR family regulator/anti-sigma regulatory factor (Ser/Thr protein kinase)
MQPDMATPAPRPAVKPAPGAPIPHKASAGSVLLVSPTMPAEANLVRNLERLGYSVDVIASDRDTLKRIADARSQVEIVVLDKRGAKDRDKAIFAELGADPRMADVQMLVLVGSQDDDNLVAALDGGFKNHLRAPFTVSILDASLRALCREHGRISEQNYRPLEEKSLLSMVETCKFRFRSPAEAKQLTPLLAAFFPDRQRAKMGITELFNNAIEHGNLEIGRELKAKLAKAGSLQQEIYTRLNKPDYADRFVEVIITRKEEGIMLVVNDEGGGFDWKEHLDVDPALANREHGRGIARARHMAFDKLTYNKAGNQAVALMTGTSQLQW